MSARFLFGQPGDWCDRNPGKLVAALFLLIASSEWLASTVAGALA